MAVGESTRTTIGSPDQRGRSRVPPDAIYFDGDPNYRGKHLQLHFTIEDEGVFTTPWSATITYGRSTDHWPEMVCAENPHLYYAGKDAAVPTADKPDF
jgi:hypothetical protein